MNSTYDVNEWRFCFILSLLANYCQTPAQPLVRGHVPQSRGCPLKRGSTVYKRSGTTRVSYFPRVSRSGPAWWSFWVERLLRVRLVSRSFPFLFTVLLCLPTAQALYITAGSLVALYNGQCMMTCITKMISDRRWQRGLLQLWARFLSFPSVSILGGSLETFKKIKGRFQSTLSKWWIKELHRSYIP